jgi:hypothetical protein
MNFIQVRRLFAVAIFLITAVGFSFAQQPGAAKVRVEVSPEEAYIFVNGHPYNHRSQTISLAPGDYTIGVYNYGFVPQVQKITLNAGENPMIQAQLKPAMGMVAGPWGRIQIEGNPDDTAAVFLNGTTPEYFVGHIDEMNHAIWAAQQLIVPVGTYEMFIVHPRETTPFWSGKVEVRANERVIVNISKDASTWKYELWRDATDIKERKRFDASTATATIVVAPVRGNITVDKKQVNCGEPVRLAWTSAEAGDVFITANHRPLGRLPLSGDQMLQPKETTTYDFRAVGPGGTITTSATVDVNKTVQTSLLVLPAEVRFHKVGDELATLDPSTLKWTAANADAVHIAPFGLVTGTEGSEPLTLVPAQMTPGPIDEMRMYTITATNACGGTDTSTASVHLTGAIEPAQVAKAEPPAQLPQTASLLPLLALLGFSSAAYGFVLRGMRKGR